MTLWQLVSNVLSVVFLDLALGGDNAAVIAMAAKNLDVHLRKKAIFFGAMGAVGCRFILAAIAVELMQIPYLKLVGALILFYIGAKLIGEQEDEETPDIKSKNTLMGAIVTIIAADAIMSLDNVLAIVGATNGHLGMVVFGILFSVPIILFGSTIIVKIMDRFPVVVYLAGMLIGWSSGGLVVSDATLALFTSWKLPLEIGGAILVGVWGYIWKKRASKAQ